MEATALTITGQCHCGEITYEAHGPIIKSSQCDCAGCRAATGTFAAPFVTVQRANHTITQGKPAVFRAESGEDCDAHGTWHFCTNCGTQLYWLGNEGNELDIFAGTLHDRSLYNPA
jgi:hypothetical protein